MKKTLKISTILGAILIAFFMVGAVVFGLRPDAAMAEFIAAPGAVERFKASASLDNKGQNKTSPLVRQARAFAGVLNPAKPVLEIPEAPSEEPDVPRPVVAVAARFDLIGTCVYTSDPSRSLALVREPGKGEHWVRQSAKIEHLVIEQIKDGSVIYKDGEKSQELFCPKKKGSSTAGADISPKAVRPAPVKAKASLSSTHRRSRGRVVLPKREPAGSVSSRKKVIGPPSQKQTRNAVEWFKKLKEDPKSMGISDEEAKNLTDLGKIIQELETGGEAEKSSKVPAGPNSP